MTLCLQERELLAWVFDEKAKKKYEGVTRHAKLRSSTCRVAWSVCVVALIRVRPFSAFGVGGLSWRL